MNQEFFNKMKEAKKLEKEAAMLLLPEAMRGHVTVIEKEMKAMLFECITSFAMPDSNHKKPGEAEKNKVHKVEIN